MFDHLARTGIADALIASKSIVPPAVMAAQGSVLTDKYAAGHPGKRNGGCEFVDKGEAVAIERLKQLFGAEYANVQPHSGAQARRSSSRGCSRATAS